MRVSRLPQLLDEIFKLGIGYRVIPVRAIEPCSERVVPRPQQRCRLSRRKPEGPHGRLAAGFEPRPDIGNGNRDMHEMPAGTVDEPCQVLLDGLRSIDEHIEIEIAPRPGGASGVTALEQHGSHIRNLCPEALAPAIDEFPIDHGLPLRALARAWCSRSADRSGPRFRDRDRARCAARAKTPRSRLVR